MMAWSGKKLAVWAITPKGAELALQVKEKWGNADLFLSATLNVEADFKPFSSFSQSLEVMFPRYDGHYFIMATGIVVRLIANFLKDKTTDPAVVVGDEAGHFVISLVSGHIGGANELARELAADIGAQAVITTSTDVNELPGIDVLARNLGLYIENTPAIKHVSMAYIQDRALPLHDPYNLVRPHIPKELIEEPAMFSPARSGVFVDYEVRDLPGQVLVLRPKCLVAGIGCRRGVPKEELEFFILGIFRAHHLSIHSLAKIVSVDLKENEPGLNQLATDLGVPICFYSTDQLNQVEMVPNPSFLVDKHIGVKSVCEAAAILATGRNHLIVPKQTNKTATIAIAIMPFTS
ncbi:MAG: cobalamin biosynthesis protein CbiG [Desulfobacterales bacterium CG23_combo_of_CG06-09_8_20_14_all_51_8]|nr:MAG: cobalamin biosynthesis protein CbiG [Desulfobacterales bacterium CG23_combo_of_CG06-09_8_20_14_all_51_8]